MHIALIVVDSLRADSLSCYGYAKETSPHIDRIAAQALMYRYAFSPSNWTFPSMYSLITGLYPSRHKITRRDFTEKLPAGVPTLPEILQEQGFRTALFSMYLSLLNRKTFASHFQVSQAVNIDQNLDDYFDFFRPGGKTFSLLHIGNYVHEPYLAPAHLVSRFAEGENPDTPLTRCFTDPAKGGNLVAPHVDPGLRHYNRWINLGLYKVSQEERDFLKAAYDAGIFYVDAYVGQIYDFFQGLGQPTLIVITADHGQPFLEHGRFGHGWSLHNDCIRVPLLICFHPQEYSGQIYEQNVQLIDLVPTLLDLVGIEVNAHFDGSILGWGAEPEAGGERVALSEGYPQVAIIGSAYKLITDFYKVLPGKSVWRDIARHLLRREIRDAQFAFRCGRQKEELYAADDPHEVRNLARGHEEVIHQLRQVIAARYQHGPTIGGEPESVGMDDELAKQLRYLGYLA